MRKTKIAVRITIITVAVLLAGGAYFTALTLSSPPAVAQDEPDAAATGVGAACLVPDVVGLHEAAARHLITFTGLRVAQTSVHDDTHAQGTVFLQSPEPETRFDPCDGDVIITVSLGPDVPTPTPTPVATPAITGTVAYIRDDDVYLLTFAGRSLIDLNGDIAASGRGSEDVTYAEEQLTEGGMHRNPVWSPDGRYLLFERHQEGISDLHLLDLETRQETLVAEDACCAAWMDETEIALLMGNSASPPPGREMYPYHWYGEVAVLSLDDSQWESTDLLAFNNALAFALGPLTWRENASLLLAPTMEQPRQLLGEPQSLPPHFLGIRAFPFGLAPQGSGMISPSWTQNTDAECFWSLAFSPDASLLAATAETYDETACGNWAADTEVALAFFGTDARADALGDVELLRVRNLANPTWSPTGEYLAAELYVPASEAEPNVTPPVLTGVALYEFESGTRVLLRRDASQPAWRPQDPVVQTSEEDAPIDMDAIHPLIHGTEANSSPSPAPVPSSNPAARVTARNLNMRAGPGVAYAIVGTYAQNTVVELNGRNQAGTWYQVSPPDGSTGWMTAAYLDVTGSPAVPVREAPAPPPTPVPPTATPLSSAPQTPTQVAVSRLQPTPTVRSCNLSVGDTFAGLYQSHRAALGCPTSVQYAVNTISEQVFEDGHLFWRKDTDIVYIIYDRRNGGGDLYQGGWDKSIDPATGRYWSWANVGEPEPDGIGLTPPPGRYEPVRGFGWLWRTYLGRESGPLGWALDRAYGFDNVAQVQTFENGIMFKGSDPKQYVLLDTGQFYAR